MPPATITRSPPAACVERPGAAERARGRRASRPGCARADRLRSPRRPRAPCARAGPARRVAADRDRHLADAEGVEHVELARARTRDRLAAVRGSSSSVQVSAVSRRRADDARGLAAPSARARPAGQPVAALRRRRRAAAAGSPAGARASTARSAASARSRGRGRPRTCRAGRRRRRRSPRRLERPRVEVPAVRRKQPGPADRSPSAERLRRSPGRGRERRSRGRPCRGGSGRSVSAGSPSRKR